MRTLAIALLLSVISACKSGSGDPRERESASQTPAVEVPINTSDSVQVTLDLSNEVRATTTVVLVVRLRNVSARSADLYLRGREITFDVIVKDSTGREVWSRLHDSIIPAIIRLEHLQPDQSLELRHSWNLVGNDGQRIPSGRYTAIGRVLTDGAPLESAPRPLVIVP